MSRAVLDLPAQQQSGDGRGDRRGADSDRHGEGTNTSYFERLNATFRGAMTPQVRRGPALARTEGTLQAGMFLVGCVYRRDCSRCWAIRVMSP
jgi:hypothetical protein